ncbi:MAG: hypothetical protein A3A82_03985 [Candidatus Pacebacteria bacterium RIFCSPLOWO2_01_FULL_47_12]|nr:MAG: hypothetical protein A3A82_03985 [Candidatus Pacebacteria bacterium RIFCSPLOWO2_01_FULL_47_12]
MQVTETKTGYSAVPVTEMLKVSQLVIGEMPAPQYIVLPNKQASPSGAAQEAWIGIEAYAPNGQVAQFLWWENFTIEGSLDDETIRSEVAAFVAQILLNCEIAAAVGPPIDLHRSASTQQIATTHDTHAIGVYIEVNRRLNFSFRSKLLGVDSEEELRTEYGEKFDLLLNWALRVLPHTTKYNLETRWKKIIAEGAFDAQPQPEEIYRVGDEVVHRDGTFYRVSGKQKGNQVDLTLHSAPGKTILTANVDDIRPM